MKLQCLICKKKFDHLGSHLWHGHHVLARDYKEEFGLPYKTSLISDIVLEKKKDAFYRNDPEGTIKRLIKTSVKCRFVKGHTGQRRISEGERKTILARIKKYNGVRKPEPCPVCHMIFDHLDSHLANKHKLLRIKN